MPSQTGVAKVNGHHSEAESAKKAATDTSISKDWDEFFNLGKSLFSPDSQDSMQVLLGIPELKSQIEARDVEKHRLEVEIVNLKKKHEDFCTNLVRTHSNSDANLQKEIAKLTDEVKSSEKQRIEEQEARKRADEANEKANTRVTKLIERLNAEREISSKFRSDILQLEQKLKLAQGTAQKLGAESKKKDDVVSRLEESIADMEVKQERILAQSQKTTQELNRYESYVEGFHKDDPEIYVEQFQNLWEAAYKAVESCFKEDLPEEFIKNPSAWEEFRKRTYLASNVPLPQSNTKAAIKMRNIAVLALLARLLNEYMFTPTYILGYSSDLQNTLHDATEKDPEKEALCRGLLLSMRSQEETEKAEDVRVFKTVEKVIKAVQTIAPKTTVGFFEAELRQIVRSVLPLWSSIQRNAKKLETFVDPRYFDDMWQWNRMLISEDDGPSVQNGLTEHLILSDNITVVFPGVYFRDGGDWHLLFRGYAVSISQMTAATVEVEREKLRSRNGTPGGHRSRSVKMPKPSPKGSEEANGDQGKENNTFLDRNY